MDEDGDFELAEGGVEIGNIATTRKEIDEFLQRSNDDITVQDGKITVDTVFVNVGDQPRHF